MSHIVLYDGQQKTAKMQEPLGNRVPRVPKYQRTVVVEWPGHEVCKDGEFIDTGGAGPCTIIGMLDRAHGIAIVGHFIEPEGQDAMGIVAMVDDALAHFPDPSRVEVALAGCSLEFDTHRPGEALETRRAVLKRLEIAGFAAANIEQHWLDRADVTQGICIDLQRLIIEVDTKYD